MMPIKIDLQYAVQSDCPKKQQFQQWANTLFTHPALIDRAKAHKQPLLSLRLVNEKEGAKLNQTWRGKTGATNVLSFPFETMAGVDLDFLGDIVICQPVVILEAAQQHKNLTAHWAHLFIHGFLHLLGYDHIQTAQAKQMEQLEIEILAQLGYANPYE
jgi:probable rRNA maturation factor